MMVNSLKEFFNYTVNKPKISISSSLIFESIDYSEYQIDVNESENILEFDITEGSCSVTIKNTISEDLLDKRGLVKFGKEVVERIVEFIDNHGEVSHMAIGSTSDEEETVNPTIVHVVGALLRRKGLPEWTVKKNGNIVEMNTTASAGGEYATPYTFAKKEKNKKKIKKISTYHEPSLVKM